MAAYVPVGSSSDGRVTPLRLDANEAPAAASDVVRDVVARAVAGVALERYPDARGMALKAAIATRTGAKVEELLLGTGSDEVIALVIERFTARPRPRPKLPQAVVLQLRLRPS